MLLERLTGFLRRPSPITLECQGRTLLFPTPADFEFALAARTALPAPRFVELWAASPAQLVAESTGVSALCARLDSILAAADRRELELGAALAALGLTVFSKDHDWRGILSSLNARQPGARPALRTALGYYRRYLASRLDAIGLVREQMKQRGVAAPPPASERETSVFKAPLVGAATPDTLRRLPPGEAVVVRLHGGKVLPIKLARYDFSLTHEQDWALVSDDGRRYPLHAGSNSVGRSRDNDVSLDAVFRNVSRRHLIAQPVDAERIMLTDVSSSGTYIPPAAIAS